MRKIKKHHILSILVILVIICLSVGYSAFGTELLVSKIAANVRIKSDIRVTGISYDENSTVDGSSSNYEDYNVKSISMGINLPNETSTFTYKIEITNIGSTEMALAEITGLPSSLDYDITDYNLEEKICNTNGSCTLGAVKEFYITIKYAENGYDKTNITHNLILYFDFKNVYNITYENIINNNYPTEIIEGKDLKINFINNIPEGVFVTGAELYTFETPNLKINNVKSDLVISNAVVYEHIGEYTFTGTNYIDTGIYLFNEENINKNFEVSFSITSYSDTQEKFGTIFNSMNEFNSDYPGIVFRVNSGMTNFEFVGNNKANGLTQVIEKFNYEDIQDVKILRINNVIYYNINGGDFYEHQDYTTFAEYFDIAATFGASYDENGQAFRYFVGKLANMKIKFLDEDESIEAFNKMYKYNGTYKFDGTNYIDTGIYLFNEENANKDFEIKFTVTSSSETQTTYATLVNSLVEVKPYCGIIFRIYGSTPTEFQLITHTGGESTTDASARFNVADVTNVSILRKSNILYYSINNQDYIQIQDYTNFTSYFEVPVTFGASLDENGEPYRYFVGSLTNFEIRIKDTV